MAGSKRMSADEKRQVILDIYHRTKQVFTEKEIVTLAAKAGVNANTILDVNNSLIDDGLVDKEKIGGSNYFWSFPAKKDRLVQLQHQQNLQAVELLQSQVRDATVALAEAQRGREDVDGVRVEQLQRLDALGRERGRLVTELAELQENDPQALADLEHELQLVTAAAHRWTDNIFNCKAYLIKKRGMDKKEVHRVLGITGTFDYPEDKIPK
jgi:DNA-binding transcriptional regulator YhcF (GntR family)